jgi:hypothetical protein
MLSAGRSGEDGCCPPSGEAERSITESNLHFTPDLSLVFTLDLSLVLTPIARVRPGDLAPVRIAAQPCAVVARGGQADQ